ncbi:substrate of the Dot/Icm secretion system [Legionella moravica]|uniref:Substrate of the Dot/Icm secretion system n=1 Tax=Legionella moravica TaxID=39962 RepID=A0A378K8G0_9GAMM|nr:hypothetical protein [Legionella moravica]KTD34393.1 substrate of the Dot/Icm secretion system [Legionella moravica]STX64111.1 substrate of the Dot/Icm secretion system [Legionella moravica]
MALSEIIINDVVKYQTNLVISEANFPTLRQYLLERKPLSSVTNEIDTFLNEHFIADKQMVLEQLTYAACESQKKSDAEEVIHDEQEKNSDGLLRTNYVQEVSAVQNRLAQLGTMIYQQNKYSAQLQSQLSEYQINLNQVERSIERLKTERRAIQVRYVVSPALPQPNVHGHPQNGIQVPNLYPVVYSIQDQLALDGLAREENRLNDELHRLKEVIRLKRSDSFHEGQQLGGLRNEQNQAEARLKYLRQQLDVELPKREQQRHIRNQERLAREQARTTDDPDLMQLSQKNREALTQKITLKIDELNRLKAKLVQSAVNNSYSLFVSQLDEALQGATQLKLGYYERDTLKTITGMMKIYLEMSGQEQTLIKSLGEARSTLQQQQKWLRECTAKLQHYERSNPQLRQSNKKLAEENERLKLNSESAGSSRSNALYVSLFVGASALVSASIIGSLVVSPLYFALSGVLALATVISLTVAVVYHFQKSSADNQMARNAKTISTNQDLILKHTREADELREHTLPDLNLSIAESGRLIAEKESELNEHQVAMQHLLAKAQNVNEFNGAAFPFFSGTSSVHSMPVTPSAPVLDMPENEVASAPLYPYIPGYFNQQQ